MRKAQVLISLFFLILIFTGCAKKERPVGYTPLTPPDETVSVDEFLDEAGRRIWFVCQNLDYLVSDEVQELIDVNLYQDTKINYVLLQENDQLEVYYNETPNFSFEEVEEIGSVKELYEMISTDSLPDEYLDDLEYEGIFTFDSTINSNGGSLELVPENPDNKKISIFKSVDPATIILKKTQNHTGITFSGFFGVSTKKVPDIDEPVDQSAFLVTPTTTTFTNINLN